MRFQLLINVIIIVCMISSIIATQATSKYEGVSWNEKRKRWQIEFDFNGKKSQYYFENECDAIKTRNRVYRKMGITPQDSEICEISNQQATHIQIKFSLKNEKTSQYKGVYWHRKNKKWRVMLSLKGEKQKYGGIFKDELDAAKRVNQLCEELRIPPQNPTINAIPNQKCQKKEKISQYNGVSWHKHAKKWHVQIYLKGQKPKYGGSFKDELDAGKRVNQLCKDLGIPPQNPAISAIPKQPYQKKEKTSQYKGVSWHKRCRKWYVQLKAKQKKTKCGGCFNDELDAAKRVNQLCEEFGIPLKNPEIVAIPNQKCQVLQHGEHQTIENRVISSEILKPDNDRAKKRKRNHKKEINGDDELPVETHYFYDLTLK